MRKNSPSNSSSPTDEPMHPLEKLALELNAKLRASGHTVTVKDCSDAEPYVVTFPPSRRLAPKSTARKRVRVSVEWGYETYGIEMQAQEWAKIQQGKEASLKSTGWYEGSKFRINWHFNSDSRGGLVVSYGDEGADGYVGSLSGATVSEVASRKAIRAR